MLLMRDRRNILSIILTILIIFFGFGCQKERKDQEDTEVPMKRKS